MIKDAPLPGSGEIVITLNGREVTLKPTLKACMGISRLHGSVRITVAKISETDFDTIVDVLALGMGIKPTDKLREEVYTNGTFDLMGDLVRFIHIVNTGGRPPKDLDEDEEGDESKENPLAPSQ